MAIKALKINDKNIDIVNQIRNKYNDQRYKSPLSIDYPYVKMSRNHYSLIGTKNDCFSKMTLEELLTIFPLNEQTIIELW
jgi:hypothetical protein